MPELKLVTTQPYKKNHSELQFDPEKMKPNAKSLRNVKNGVTKKHITAFDFEVLTYEEEGERKTIPTQLGVYQLTDKDEIGKSTGVYHGVGSRTKMNYESITPEKDNVPKKKRWMNQVGVEGRKAILETILKTLTNINHRDKYSLNFFYNLKYDMSQIISLLQPSQISHLRKMEEITVSFDSGASYQLSTIGGKSFTIKKGEHKHTFYDLKMFTNGSLEATSKKWLGEEVGGKTEGFDTAKVYNDPELLKEKYYESSVYCLRDVELTAKVGKMVKKSFEAMEIPYVTPFSPASLFKTFTAYHKKHRHQSENGDGIPPYDGVTLSFDELEERYNDERLTKGKWEELKRLKMVTRNLQRNSYNAYYGGLFEMFKRGYFENVTGLDYTSMYPSVMVDLPNYSKCRIDELEGEDAKKKLDDAVAFNKKYRNLKKNKRNRNKYHAVIKANIWIDENAIIAPFPVNAQIKDETRGKTSSKIIRPILRGQETTFGMEMYEFITAGSYPHIEGIEIIECHLLEIIDEQDVKKNSQLSDEDITDYPFEFMQDLFNRRVEIIKEHGKEDKRQEVLKTLINSGYGVMAETVDKQEWEYDEEDEIYSHLGNTIEAGKLSRPFYAMHITEWARLKIYQDIFDNDLEKDILGVATDCLFLTSDEAVQKFEHKINRTGEKILGALEVEKSGEMLVLGNGLYQFRHDDGETVEKTTRGFHEGNFPNLFERTDLYQDKEISVSSTRPTTWSEMAMSLDFKEDNQMLPEAIGVFSEETKKANINMDTARVWERDFENIGEMFKYQVNSKPITLQEV